MTEGGYEVPGINELYDYVTNYKSRRDVGFYVEEARSTPRDVLELGCGTGRVLIPVARLGKHIVGVDASPAMLAQARARLEREPLDVRERVTLVPADMRELDLSTRFSLIMIPFRPFQHLLSIDDQLATLESAQRHLEPGGRLAFDVFNPSLRHLMDEKRAEEREDTAETSLPDGRTFTRTGRVAATHIVDQYSEAELIYYVRNTDGSTERLVHAFYMRWFWRYEVEHLLARTGFRLAAVYGDFDRSQLTDESPEMIFIAERI
jgi:SAM-dependent methyltransferase